MIASDSARWRSRRARRRVLQGGSWTRRILDWCAASTAKAARARKKQAGCCVHSPESSRDHPAPSMRVAQSMTPPRPRERLDPPQPRPVSQLDGGVPLVRRDPTTAAVSRLPGTESRGEWPRQEDRRWRARSCRTEGIALPSGRVEWLGRSRRSCRAIRGRPADASSLRTWTNPAVCT